MPMGTASQAAGTKMSSVQVTFKREFAIFCDDLQNNPKHKKKLAFVERIKANIGTSSPEKIANELEDLVKHARSSPMRKVFSRIQPILGAIKDYTGVIETMVQAYPFPTALIWGGLKIVLECAGRYNKQFDLIKEELSRLTDVLFELSGFEEIHGTSLYGEDAVQRVLSLSYQTLLKFWYRCTKILENPGRYIFITNTKLLRLVEELESNRRYLTRVRDTVELHLNKDLRENISKIIEQMEIDRQKTEEERQKEREQKDVERHERTWLELGKRVQFKEDNELNSDAYHQGINGRHTGTCNWLFQTNEFNEWAADNSTKHTFWLSGKHGAGKSFLCSSAIEHIAKTNRSPVVFRFLTKDFYVTRNQILRHLASALLSCLSELLPQPKVLPDSFRRFIQINVNDSAEVQSLIRIIVSELPKTYIFIDGLDEPEYTDDKSRPAPARGDDVQAVIEFLIKDIAESSANFKLWLSSQPIPEIRRYVCKSDWVGGIQEFSLQTKHTEKDILNYLGSAIGTPTANNSLGRIFVKSALASEVEGSFLWVNTMLKDLQSQVDDDSELLELAKEGLPTEMNKVYTSMMNRLQSQRKVQDGFPLWKITLSLITFAKRPLKMGEIIEAIAMTRTDLGHDLNLNKITSSDRILSSCKALIRHQVIDGSSPLDLVVRLSHSAVRTFLLKNSDVQNSDERDEGQYVTSQIIKDCCIRYWMQPRYRRPLKRIIQNGTNHVSFQAHNGQEVKNHRLLNYAAKYWYQHFDSHSLSNSNSSSDATFMLRRSQSELMGPLDADKLQVVNFLRSPNFQTCLQVQSLFVVGHFMQTFDQITDEATALRRTLPNWIPKLEPETHRQYADFQSEWCHLLVPGRQSNVYGELDRCFWMALGPSNFLSGNKGRYRAFQLQDGLRKEETVCGQSDQFIKTSSDGRAVVVCSVAKQGERRRHPLGKWMLDGVSAFKSSDEIQISVSLVDANMQRYWTPSSDSFRSVPLIPNVNCVVPPAALAPWLDSNCHCPAVRIGSQLFQNSQTASKSDFALTRIDNTRLDNLWDDIAALGPYLVVCRRRVPRPELPPDKKEKESRRVQFMKARVSNRQKKRDLKARRTVRRQVPPNLDDLPKGLSRRFLKHYINVLREKGDTMGEDSSSDSSEPDYSDSDSLDEHSSDYLESDSLDEDSSDSSGCNIEGFDSSSAEESWSEGSSGTDSDYSDGSIPSHFASDSDNERLDPGSGFERDRIARDYGGEEASLEHEALEHEAGIASIDHGRRVNCDYCGTKSLRQYYHCIRCNEDNFVLCCPCERQGRWCLNKSHQLFRMVKSMVGRKAVGMVTRRNFCIRQEILVFRNGEQGDDGKILFQLRKNYNSLLYQSPPAIHPQHQLVVWPLTGRILLFADFQAKKFFEHKIKATGTHRKAREICVNLSFSTCGQHLRVATIAAEVKRTPTTQCHPSQKQAKNKLRDCLNLHVSVLRLSPSKTTRNPPKLLYSTTFHIGPYYRPFIQELPFTFTWRATELFVTLSDLCLRVYRIQLPDVEDPADYTIPHTGTNIPISSTLMNKIYLPRSSKHRSVQYFPPHATGGNSTVIISPRYGRFPAPAIGVYLTPESLGGWVAVSSGEQRDGSGVSVPKQAILGELEDFDGEEECDIIPFEW